MFRSQSLRDCGDGGSMCSRARMTVRSDWTTNHSSYEQTSSAGYSSVKTRISWLSRPVGGDLGRRFVGILYAHQQGASLGRLVDDIELLATCMSQRNWQIALRIFPYSRTAKRGGFPAGNQITSTSDSSPGKAAPAAASRAVSSRYPRSARGLAPCASAGINRLTADDPIHPPELIQSKCLGKKPKCIGRFVEPRS